MSVWFLDGELLTCYLVHNINLSNNLLISSLISTTKLMVAFYPTYLYSTINKIRVKSFRFARKRASFLHAWM